jgi:hypothetical protein
MVALRRKDRLWRDFAGFGTAFIGAQRLLWLAAPEVGRNIPEKRAAD